MELSLDDEQERVFENYVCWDDNLPCCGQLTDEEIINEIVQDTTSDATEEDEEEGIVNDPPSAKDVFNSLNILSENFLPKNLFSHELDNMEKSIIEQFSKPKIQSVMTAFLKPI